jgi:hypothetical protein
MAFGNVPWSEPATAISRSMGASEFSATVLFEGTLLQVALALSKRSRTDLKNVRVSLPERQAAPRTFEGDALYALLDRAALERELAALTPKS